ncbi:MAG TPA: DUF3177 domain-containing protein [Cyanobacteria bacterium UBA12227]|nr:DUF3177 domain-containing protein [Cyanobacteria bacterium UBA12227]HAX86355.1 DUF3177 domain-containing protein [Cyanobacteria bacterium UBA11370]HBY81159.1 DUF3177 domain-containing protein [Cyanobacteria bacterium UBA11148]
MQDELLRALVWTDYRLAVLFTVLIPLILLIWALLQKADAMLRLLIIYWRVSSLLAITIYILIASWPIGFVSGFCARILIPISLWFWVDLNEDIDDRPASPLKLILTAWRWAITLYCTLGALWNISSLRCAFSPGAIKSSFCQVWLEPAFLFKQYFHANSKPEFLGFLGMVGLFFYVLYLSYFVLIRLGKQGRSAMEQ